MTEHDITNEAHRETCAECTATWAELDAISAEARALPTLTPSRDLWAGIAARIGGAAGEASSGASEPTSSASSASPAAAASARRWFAAPALRYAAAAAVLVAATATVTWRIANDVELPTVRDPNGRPIVIAPSAGDDTSGDRIARIRAASYEEDFVTLDLEVRTLQAMLDQRRSMLDSTTVAVVERNLKLIDTAIAESRAAFLRDPASQFLAAQLARSYTTKITLLRTTATMPSGT